MADQKIKIMDLTAGTPVDADYIPFIDVSDTTQSPEGTTKRGLKSALNGADGNGIASVALINTTGLVKTYRITFTDATTFDYDVTDGEDGRSIVSIIRTSGDGSPGTTDTYTITYDKAPLTSTFDVYNGSDGTGDVNGPASAVDENIAVYDGITGKIIKDSGINKNEISTNTSNRNLSKVSANDTTGGYLNGKLIAGANITFVEGSDGGNETLTISSTGGAGDTINTTINNVQKDSSAGTSTTKGTLSGLINGSNTVFTVSEGVYVSGSLTVTRNGKELVEGSSEDYVETAPGSGTFTFNTAPVTGDVIGVEYDKQDITSSAILVSKNTTSVSANYIVLASDGNVLVDASGGDITITLPSTGALDSLGVLIKKVDSSGNTVTIATPGSETIDNSSSIIINEPYEGKVIITDGTNYFIR